MKAWKQRCNALLSKDASTQQLQESTTTLVNEMGFEYWVYSLEAPLPISAPRTFVMNNFPADIVARLATIRGNKIMPPARHARISGLPFYWPPQACPPEDAAFWHGMQVFEAVGVALPAPYRAGSTGCLTLARVSGPLTLPERTANEARWVHLAYEVDHAMRQRGEEILLPAIEEELTVEERDVLKWAADGKSAWETAQITGLTERNVSFYRTRAQRKVGAKNLVEAVARAVRLELLTAPTELAGMNAR